MQTHTLWYTRKDGEVKGPFPRTVIAQYMLLNRLRKEDEVSIDQECWQRIGDVSELVPKAVKGTLSGSVNQYLLDVAKRGTDNRAPLARSEIPGEPINQYLLDVAKRNSSELAAELDDVQEYRRVRAQAELVAQKKKPINAVVAVVVILTIAGALAALALNYTPQSGGSASDCAAAPAAQVNWSNCSFQSVNLDNSNLQQAVVRNADLSGSTLRSVNLQGGDLAYSNLSLANLSRADLRGVQLTGARISGADLSQADLSGADLSYADLSGANLSGANLTGAKLDQAVWVDKTVCGRGSVGRCMAGGGAEK